MPRRRSVEALLALAVVLTACAPPLPPLPLRPEPVPYADTLPVPKPSSRQAFDRVPRLLLVNVPDQLAEPLRGREEEALNLTHYDDVVSSAWFEHRNGRTPLAPEEVRRGPTRGPGPDTARTLTVVEGKRVGVAPGFRIEDARGDTYIVKLDPPEMPWLATAPGVIVNRLTWAAGYHVPEDYLFVFRAERLAVSEDAVLETPDGERPMTAEDLRSILEEAHRLEDGRYLALASKFAEGEPLGPFHFFGVREDDPNDHYHHEYRRELRGLRVLSAWLNNTDVRPGNTLDTYVEPGYVRHYLIDFGTALGSASHRPKHPKDGAERPLDIWAALTRLVTLGFYEEGWEDEDHVVTHPELGWMRVESYDPGEWRVNWANPAFNMMTTRDAYWGAKLVASFSEAQIRAAVAAAGLPEAALADTLTRMLMVRRDRTVRHWLSRVSPLEEPRIVPDPGPAVAPAGSAGGGAAEKGGHFVLRFRDLGVAEGLRRAGEVHYAWTFRHEALGREASGSAWAARTPEQHLEVRWEGGSSEADRPLSDEDALAVLRITAIRPGAARRAATVYLTWEAGAGRYRVAGLVH